MERKIFISHSSLDQKYIGEFVKLLKKFGFHDKDIFYSSDIANGVQPGEIILNRLKEELENQPVVLYFLSENYYSSTICLNEMGASWMVTDKHYPIALPGFSSYKIKGAINNDRLAIMLNKKTSVKELHSLLKQLSADTGIVADEDVAIDIKGNIEPFQKDLKKLIEQENYLVPDEDGYFETILVDEREDKGTLAETHDCFKLPKMIAPEKLGLDSSVKNEKHWLLFFKTNVQFHVNDKVRFKLANKQPKKDYTYRGMSHCRNIYIYDLEKVE